MPENNFLIIALCLSITACFISCKMTNKAFVTNERKFEGSVLLENKVYRDVDSDGVPINEITGNDSMFISVHRKMFLKGGYMIDINENTAFVDGNYTKKDTIGYTLYHFSSQRFVRFKTLSADAAIIKKGFMSDPDGSFSDTLVLDPMNDIQDSIWRVTDAIINGDSIGVVNFLIMDGADSLEMKLAKSVKFWVNYSIKDFPLQLSYILSKKLRNGFIYKMQLPVGDGKAVMVTSFNYQPSKLSDTLVTVFEKWARVAEE